MDTTDYAITTFGLVSGIAATVGYSVAVPAPKVAKSCCWVSASAFGLTGCIWAAHATDQSMLLRRVVGAAIGAVAGLALTWALEQIDGMNSKVPPTDPTAPAAAPMTNNQGIVTQNQSGGTNTVNNIGSVARRLSLEQREAFIAVAKAGCANSSDHVAVTAALSNNEAQVYATDFINALKAAGCSADLELPIPGLKPEVNAIRIGIRGALFQKHRAPLIAQNVANALTAAKLEFFWNPIDDNFFADRQFVLIIGAK